MICLSCCKNLLREQAIKLVIEHEHDVLEQALSTKVTPRNPQDPKAPLPAPECQKPPDISRGSCLAPPRLKLQRGYAVAH